MSKPLVEVLTFSLRDGLDSLGCEITSHTLRPAVRHALADLEKEGYVVVPVRPTEEMTRIAWHDDMTFAEIYAEMINARPRHGISHPQAPYTPEPRKE